MDWTPIDINPDIYLVGVKANLVEWLSYYLNDPSEAWHQYWARMGETVSVYAGFPEEEFEDELLQPRVRIVKMDDEAEYTTAIFEQVVADQAKHEMTFRIDALTSSQCGGALGNSAVASAVQKIFAEHHGDLDALGIQCLGLSRGVESRTPEGLEQTSATLKVNFYLQGRLRSTVALALATAQLLSVGQVSYQIGHTLTVPQLLAVRLLTGTQMRTIHLTVNALNEAAKPATLSVDIPPGMSAEQTLALAPAQVGEKYTAVTGMSILDNDGMPGVRFEIRNIPEVY